MPRFQSATRQDRNFLAALAGIQVFCGTVFGMDIVYESHLELINNAKISAVETVHLVVEAIAVCLLFFGYRLAYRELKALHNADDEKARLLSCLRGHFDEIINAQFKEWNLSPAERDIALLSLRGSRISDIAKMRSTSEGTVKAQLSAVYHKSGINTRGELLAHFMDEFLDYASADDIAMSNAAPASKSAAAIAAGSMPLPRHV